MAPEPSIVDRAERPYAAITAFVTMDAVETDLPPLVPELFGALAVRGVTVTGAPFWKYDFINMETGLRVQVGVPVAAVAAGAERVAFEVLPAGRYATLTHVGHPSGLRAASAQLLEWARTEGLKWAMTEDGGGEQWTARLEIYETDPANEPNPAKWSTRLEFLLAD